MQQAARSKLSGIPSLNATMGRIIAQAWKEPLFLAALENASVSALRKINLVIPDNVELVVHVSNDDAIHLTLSAPPLSIPESAVSDIRDFGEVYRDPRLWSLNWVARDPVATRRMTDNPKRELARFGVKCPDNLAITVHVNASDLIHLIIPPRPREALLSGRLLANLAAGIAPSGLRYGRLFGIAHHEDILHVIERYAEGTQ